MVKHRSPKPRFRVRIAAGPQRSGGVKKKVKTLRCIVRFLLFGFFVGRPLSAPIAKLRNFNFALYFFLVLFGPVVRPLAL